MKMLRTIFLFFLLPVICQAQSRKNDFTIYREIGFTGGLNSVGLHYTWQTQLSKKLYLGAGAEAIRVVQKRKEGLEQKDNVLPVSFRLSRVTGFNGLRLVPFIGAGAVLTQPAGTMVEGGLALAAGKWQFSAAGRWFETDKTFPSVNSGVFLRLSRLLVRPASKKPVPAPVQES